MFKLFYWYLFVNDLIKNHWFPKTSMILRVVFYFRSSPPVCLIHDPICNHAMWCASLFMQLLALSSTGDRAWCGTYSSSWPACSRIWHDPEIYWGKSVRLNIYTWSWNWYWCTFFYNHHQKIKYLTERIWEACIFLMFLQHDNVLIKSNSFLSRSWNDLSVWVLTVTSFNQ